MRMTSSFNMQISDTGFFFVHSFICFVVSFLLCFSLLFLHRFRFALIFFFIGYFISKPFSRRADVFFGVIAIPLFLASGYFILTNLDGVHKLLNDSTYKKTVAKGWLAVANGVVFILDIVFHCFE